MIEFAMFWLATCFFLVISVPKKKPLVYLELIVFIISAIAMLGRTVGKAGGLGPIARRGSAVHGFGKRWLILRILMLGAAICSTFANIAAEFQRYARSLSISFPETSSAS